MSVCSCSLDASGRRGCEEGCINRMMFYECHKDFCPCGERCVNRRFQNREWAPRLVRFIADKKGYGIKTRDPLAKSVSGQMAGGGGVFTTSPCVCHLSLA